MKKTLVLGFFAGLAGALLPGPASAVVVDFTGGTITFLNGTTQITQNSGYWENVDYYEQGGFRLDFKPNSGSGGFSTEVGDYYGAGNDVIHAHWSTGDYGGVTSIEITKVGGGTFDLNYFILTSNTATGGSAASGLERAWLKALDGAGVQIGAAVLLPPEDWGFPATQIFLGSQFNAVTTAVFYVENAVDCFGMDEFYIDEPAPPPVPEGGSTLSLLALALAGLALRFRRH